MGVFHRDRRGASEHVVLLVYVLVDGGVVEGFECELVLLRSNLGLKSVHILRPCEDFPVASRKEEGAGSAGGTEGA